MSTGKDTRVIDFDAYRREQKGIPIDFIIGGKHYPLPASLPASVAVDTIRMKADMDADTDVPLEMMDQFGASVFGPTVWQALLIEHRITVDEINPLMEKVLAEYTEAPKEEAASQT